MSIFQGQETTAAAARPLRRLVVNPILIERMVPTRETRKLLEARGEDKVSNRAWRDCFVETCSVPDRPGVDGYHLYVRETSEGFVVYASDKHTLRRVLPTLEKALEVFHGVKDWTTKTGLRRRGFAEW